MFLKEDKDWKPNGKCVEIVKDQFYFQVSPQDSTQGDNNPQIHYISTFQEYLPKELTAYEELMPVVSLSDVVVYCCKVVETLNSLHEENKVLYHVTTTQKVDLHNSVLLAGCFCILIAGYRPDSLMKYFSENMGSANIEPFSGVKTGSLSHDVFMEHFFSAVAKAGLYGFIDIPKFNVAEARDLERGERGSIHWIIPEKLLTFPCPNKKNDRKNSDIEAKDAKFYLQYFKDTNVSTLVRLVKESYSSSLFTDAGINVVEIDFKGEKLPSALQVTKFIATVSNAKGAVAVHCEAGLGRTGTMISLFLMENYHFSALEAIAWFRLLRAGNVTEAQQVFLVDMQNKNISTRKLELMAEIVDKYQLETRSRFKMLPRTDSARPGEPFTVRKKSSAVSQLFQKFTNPFKKH